MLNLFEHAATQAVLRWEKRCHEAEAQRDKLAKVLQQIVDASNLVRLGKDKDHVCRYCRASADTWNNIQHTNDCLIVCAQELLEQLGPPKAEDLPW